MRRRTTCTSSVAAVEPLLSLEDAFFFECRRLRLNESRGLPTVGPVGYYWNKNIKILFKTSDWNMSACRLYSLYIYLPSLASWLLTLVKISVLELTGRSTLAKEGFGRALPSRIKTKAIMRGTPTEEFVFLPPVNEARHGSWCWPRSGLSHLHLDG